MRGRGRPGRSSGGRNHLPRSRGGQRRCRCGGRKVRPDGAAGGVPGLRLGELAGLRPHRIQFLRGRLEVVEALKETGDGHYFGTPSKYGRVRSVPLPPFLVEELAGCLAKFPPEHDLVFASPEGSMLRRSNFNRPAWAPAVALAGVDPRLTFHGLRHSAVSIQVSSSGCTRRRFRFASATRPSGQPWTSTGTSTRAWTRPRRRPLTPSTGSPCWTEIMPGPPRLLPCLGSVGLSRRMGFLGRCATPASWWGWASFSPRPLAFSG
jgi:hypothetical protein